ncbi:hypothetical protein CKAH01_18005 [Colletotrichum kahawae]|uniref:Uncharacterized protein n=1 Tax=Colletotrichum kahawae TaxID=34407 RepID=A0AAE0D3J8_COLKA|nr:hypothetical protein CKAH01_18005 [Colletotrichum kahawae]
MQFTILSLATLASCAAAQFCGVVTSPIQSYIPCESEQFPPMDAACTAIGGTVAGQSQPRKRQPTRKLHHLLQQCPHRWTRHQRPRRSLELPPLRCRFVHQLRLLRRSVDVAEASSDQPMLGSMWARDNWQNTKPHIRDSGAWFSRSSCLASKFMYILQREDIVGGVKHIPIS